MHFVGRVLGKAVMEGYTVPFNFTPPLFKAILGSPFTLADLEYVCLHDKLNGLLAQEQGQDDTTCYYCVPPAIQTHANIF